MAGVGQGKGQMALTYAREVCRSRFVITLDQSSPTILAPGIDVMEDSFSVPPGEDGFRDEPRHITFIVHVISNLIPPLI